MQKYFMQQFRSKVTAICWAVVLSIASLHTALSAQTNPAVADPEYKVLSLRELGVDSGSGQGMWHGPDHRLKLTNVTLRHLIGLAFDVQNAQVAGLPDWATSFSFDIVLQSDGSQQGTLQGAYLDRRRVQLLLRDYFGLSFHWEERELDAYVMRVEDGGPKFKTSAIKDGGWRGVGLDTGNLVGRDTPMIRVAEALSRELGHTVLNGTELEGTYDFHARWVSKTGKKFRWIYGGSSPARSTAPPELAPSLPEAMSTQLGLILERKKTPAITVVVDDVKRPAQI